MNALGMILAGYVTVCLIAEIIVLIDFGFRKFKTREQRVLWEKKVFAFHRPFHAIYIIVLYYKTFIGKGLEKERGSADH